MKKNWTRFMALVLSMAMALTLMQGVALAAETAPVSTQEAVVLNQANTCGDNLTWAYSDKTLTISGTGKMYDYNTKDAPWERYEDTTTKVVISSGVTSVGAEAFDGFERVTSISLPSSLTTIGAGAFEECEAVTSITIPAKVTSIGREAFGECRSLTKITFKGNAPTIGTNAFEDVKATVTYPANNSTWTADVRQNYGGKLTWKSSSSSTSSSSSSTTTTTVTKLSKPDVEDPINKPKAILVSWEKVKNAKGYYVYRKTGSATKWTKVATVKGGNVLSWKDTKATTNGTKYTYTVRAYAGSVKSSYEKGEEIYRLTRGSITSKKSSAKKKLTVKWKKNAKASGYQVQYSTSSSFTKKTTKTVSGASTLSKTISGLKSGKKYYVRVRSYKKVKGEKYYSAWSTVSSVTVK